LGRPDTHQVIEISQDYEAHQLAFDFRETDPYFQRVVIVAEYAEILKGSYWAEESSLEDVYSVAARLKDYLYIDDEMEEFIDLIEKAFWLQ
jgi:Ca-activated chloride channel family protein